MGAATSSIFSEVYLQYTENTVIYDILLKYHIVSYFWYIDDILGVYNKTMTNIYDIFNTFNNLMPITKFTTEEEKENKTLPFRKKMITSHLTHTGNQLQQILSFPITLVIQKEQKLAAIRYLVNRMETYNLNAINKEKENSTIKQTLYNNKHDVSVLNKFTTSGNKRKRYAKNQMGQVYLCRERNKIHHKTFQQHSSKNRVHNTKYNWKITLHKAKPLSGKI
jgi:hypothetical protein